MSGVLCPACAAPLPEEPAIVGSDRLHGLPGRFEVVECARCGSGRTLPEVETEDLGALYPADYSAHALPPSGLARSAATALFRARYRRALRRTPLKAIARREPGRLLDVGSGRGDLGVVLAERGWKVQGVEPSPAGRAEAERRGVPTVEGTLESAAPEIEPGLDAVAFQHSLEHVADPARELGLARDLLADDGLVLVSLPNYASWQRRRYGADWFHLDLPRHRSHLTPAGLTALLGRTGFDVAELDTSTSADGWPGSLQYRRYGRRRFAGGAGLYAVIAASLAIAPAVALADRRRGGGDVLHAAGRKR